MINQIEEKLSQANDLRESEQYSESAKLYTECLLELVQTGDPEGLIHCLGGQSLIYKILLRQIDTPIYRHLTQAFAKEAFDIAEQNQQLHGRVLSIAYSSYADSLLMGEKFAEALHLFEKSLSVSTADVPEKGRLKSHIGGIKYILGDKEVGIDLIKEALADIRTGDMSAYAIRVWETGALNGLAKIYAKEDNLDEAKKLAEESLQIATEHNLSIRKREVEEIISKLSSGETDFSL
jgi:tetratricopeptide (TPR) repeat protein